MALLGPEDQLDEDDPRQRRGEGPVGRRGGTEYRSGAAPVRCREEDGRRHHHPEEHLPEHPVDDGEEDARGRPGGVRCQGEGPGHPEPPEDPLDDHCGHGRPGEEPQPPPPVLEVDHHRHRHGRQPHQGAEEAMGVLVVDAPCHSGKREEEHVGPERIRPVDHRQARPVTRHHASHQEEEQGRQGRHHREPERPVPRSRRPGAAPRPGEPARSRHEGRGEKGAWNPEDGGHLHAIRTHARQKAAEDEEVDRARHETRPDRSGRSTGSETPGRESPGEEGGEEQNADRAARRLHTGEPSEVADQPHTDAGPEPEDQQLRRVPPLPSVLIDHSAPAPFRSIPSPGSGPPRGFSLHGAGISRGPVPSSPQS